ncbi:hypothetical protein VTK26DRAFT_9463 [Humicola hyalothermophila]
MSPTRACAHQSPDIRPPSHHRRSSFCFWAAPTTTRLSVNSVGSSRDKIRTKTSFSLSSDRWPPSVPFRSYLGNMFKRRVSHGIRFDAAYGLDKWCDCARHLSAPPQWSATPCSDAPAAREASSQETLVRFLQMSTGWLGHHGGREGMHLLCTAPCRVADKLAPFAAIPTDDLRLRQNGSASLPSPTRQNGRKYQTPTGIFSSH